MHDLKKVYQKARTTEAYIEGYFAALKETLDAVNPRDISAAIEMISATRSKRKRIYIIGNGGSASIASHMANDLASTLDYSSAGQPSFKVTSLCDNSATLSAIANDHSYEEVFSRQIAQIGEREDLLIALSASGLSKNIIKGLEVAKSLGMHALGIYSFNDAPMNGLCDLSIKIPANNMHYGIAEDLFLSINHIIVSYLKYSLEAKISPPHLSI